MATHVWHDESPAARAFAAFDSSWASPNAMLNTDDLGHELPNPFAPATPENMIFGLDDVLSEQTQAQTALPRTGMLGWEAEPMAAYTNFDQLGLDDSDLDPSHGHFYLSHPGSFSGSPSSWDVGPGFNIDPPQTPDSPSLTQDSFGVSPGLAPPFSPQPQIATSLPTEHPFTAPSTWQIFFTEYLQNYKNTNPERKLNVSQAAKDGGAAYKALTSEQKEIYKRKARLAKEEYERELAAWQRMLTPDDIRTENAYRAAQRKAGKSRRSNLKDPNAPKKPLSAYFMFLQWIRADQARVIEVFGDETETTRQSVLAAAKWRTLSDAEKKPFLAQAEREKLDYEAARKEYEERTSGIANPGPYTGTGYMRIQSSASSGWHHTSADSGPDGLQLNLGGRRSSASSNGKMAGGASFGALMFAPSPVFDEDIAESNEGDVFGQWKAE
ncbi:exp1-like protein [Ceratobasidium sp. 395]|nr:exp1-like protein [Ceratobasidium sp. 395]